MISFLLDCVRKLVCIHDYQDTPTIFVAFEHGAAVRRLRCKKCQLTIMVYKGVDNAGH